MNNYFSKEDYEKDVKEFEKLTTQMLETFKKKRNDYGPSSRLTYNLFGPDSMAVRMFDKLLRFANLTTEGHETKVKDESVIDTLVDLANYALIAVIEYKYYRDIISPYKDEN